MGKKLFVSNLDFEVTTEKLREMFDEVGQSVSIVIALDKETKRSKGFAFIEMQEDDAAAKAIETLNNKVINGRPMKVVEDRGKNISTAPSENNKRHEILPAIQRTQLFKRRKRLDPFMQDATKSVDYRDVGTLSRFLSERGRINSRRLTGLSAYNQRKVSKAIKRAQNAGMMPFSNV